MEELKNYFLDVDTPTAEEVARVIIHSWADEFRQIANGNYKPKPILTPELLENLLSKMSEVGREEGVHLLNLKEWISKNYPIASAHIQQAQGNLNEIIKELRNVEVLEDVNCFKNNLPFIMTEKQYDRYEKMKKELFLKKEKSYNILQLIKRGVVYYKLMLENKPRTKNPLKQIKKIYEKEVIEGHSFLAAYQINKWEFIKDCVLSDFYTCFETNDTKSFEEFLKDFSILYNAMIDDIKENLQLKTENVFEKIYSLEELYEKNIYGFKSLCFPSSIYENDFRALKNGIAVIKNDSLTPISETKIDKNGNYIQPEMERYFSNLGLNAYLNSENVEERKKEKREDFQAIKESYYFIQGYNKGIKIIAEKYNLKKEIDIFLVEQKQIEKCIKLLNVAVQLARHKIVLAHFDDVKEKKERLKVLKEVFETIRIEELQTSKDNISEFKKIIGDKYFTPTNPDAINSLAEWIFK